MTTATNLQVAETIRDQLGGRRFDVMTGAKLHIGGANYLTFRLPSNFARNGINCVRITLNALDLYDVEFLKVRGVKVAEVATECNVYGDNLRAVFTAATGLDTSL